jgi:hypothetical protein
MATTCRASASPVSCACRSPQVGIGGGMDSEEEEEDDDDDMPCFRMTNTASSYAMFAIFDRYLKAARKAKRNSLYGALEHALAITVRLMSAKALERRPPMARSTLKF